MPIKSAAAVELDWQAKRAEQMLTMEREIDKYILFSYSKNFRLNQRDIELFEPSKILGDIFEALIGAVFIDGGGMQ